MDVLEVDKVLTKLDHSKSTGPTPTHGILAILVPMQMEMRIARASLKVLRRQKMLEFLLEEMQAMEEYLQPQGKGLWQTMSCKNLCELLV